MPTGATHHLATLDLPLLTLEIFADPALTSEALAPCNELVRHAWLHFVPIARREGLFASVPGLENSLEADTAPTQTLELELTWPGNAAIRALNRDYRAKDEATDVLSFALGLETGGGEVSVPAAGFTPWSRLPVIPLGSLFISLEWYYGNRNADEDVSAEKTDLDGFARYVAERFIHGVLHLLGFHHDTMEAYRRVVDIQNRVLQAVFAEEN